MNFNFLNRTSTNFHMRLGAASLLAAMCLHPVPAKAHHSTSMYDMEQVTTIKGIVTRLEWTNPHTYIDLDVKNDAGLIDKWTVESACPEALTRNGWHQATVKEGDVIAVTGHRAKDGSKTMQFLIVVMSDGRAVSLFRERYLYAKNTSGRMERWKDLVNRVGLEPTTR